jgi:hypothetical protein
MAIDTTIPRQVNIVKCALLSPALTRRATNDADRQLLETWGYDLMPYVQRIDLYESIFDNTISGSILLYENIGLPEYLPIVGAEFVDLAFTIDSDGEPQNFRCLFRVVSLKDQGFPRTDFRLYTLNLATPEFVQSVSSRISRRFDNISCHDAARQIMSQDLGIPDDKVITDETTFGKVSIVMPLSTPLRAIHYFLLLAQTLKTPHESNFVFFQTLAGFHFTSVRKLIENAPTTQADLPVFEVNPAVTGTNTTTDQVQQNIIRAHQDQSFDLLFDIGSGMLRSRMIHFDILARKSVYDFPIRDVDSTYTDSFDQTTHLDKWPVYPAFMEQSVSKDVRLFTVPSNVWSSKSAYVQSNSDEPDQRLFESVVARNRQFKELMHTQLLLDVPGQPDIRAGSVVWVNYPSTRPLEGAENSNINLPLDASNAGTQYYSGRHLVASVHHIITITMNNAAEYRTNLKVVKDSLRSPMFGFDAPTQ